MYDIIEDQVELKVSSMSYNIQKIYLINLSYCI